MEKLIIFLDWFNGYYLIITILFLSIVIALFSSKIVKAGLMQIPLMFILMPIINKIIMLLQFVITILTTIGFGMIILYIFRYFNML